MGEDKKIQELEMYHPEIYLKANKVIESYNELLGEIIKYAEKEGWNPFPDTPYIEEVCPRCGSDAITEVEVKE